MSGIRLSQLHTWATHEANAREVLLEALTSLKEEENLPIKENDVSTKLLFCIRRANRRLHDEEGRGIPHPIIPQAEIAADPNDLYAISSEAKKPDFQWGMIDETVEDPAKADRHLTIECKRLGRYASGHNLNVDYVEKGVLRFTTKEHRYGRYTDSGIMIGYIQNMDPADVLNEVNVATTKNRLPPISLSPTGWQQRGVSLLEHILDRSFIISPFLLRHFWVDLQHCYPSILNKVPKT